MYNWFRTSSLTKGDAPRCFSNTNSVTVASEDGLLGEYFKISSSVVQGDILSPLFFSMYDTERQFLSNHLSIDRTSDTEWNLTVKVYIL